MQPRFQTALILLVAAAACGGDGDPTPEPDAKPLDIGFNRPTAALKANANRMEVGPADLGCLGTPANDPATTVAVALTKVVKDFQNNTPVPGAAVSAFRNTDVSQPFDSKTADGDGMISIVVPVGVTRFGFKMTHTSSLDTLLLHEIVDQGLGTQPIGTIQIVSKATGTLLPALINKSRTPGTGVLAGAMRDCQGREMSNFIATVSSTRGTAAPLSGADTYYFDAGLPVRHTARASSSPDGLFMVIELPVTAAAYVQVWGYPTDADLAADQLKLIAEREAPVIAETVITGAYAPLRQ